MKKFLVCIMSMICAAALCACGGETAGTEAESTAAPSSEEAYYFEVKGVKVAMNAPAADIVAALGEPKSYHEDTSCAFNGLDKQYQYGSYTIFTYPVDGVDYVLQVVLFDDTVGTKEGVYIGSTAEQVTAAYGQPESTTAGGGMIYKAGDCELTVICTDGVVTSIQYYAQTDLK